MPATRPIRSRLTAISALVTAAALLSACSGGSDAQPTAGSSTSTSSASSATAAPTTGSSSSGSSSSTGSSPAVISGTTSVAPSSRSSKPAPSTPEPSGSAAVGSFDAGTVRYFAALCSGLQDKPRDLYEGLTGDLATKRAGTVSLFTRQAERLDGAAEGMKAAGTPNIPEGAKLASVTIATYPKMAAAARDGSKLVAAATTQAALDDEFQAARAATDAAAAPLDDLAEIIGAPAVVGQMKKIAACASVLNG